MPWIGDCGHRWEAKVPDRLRYQTGCPFCNGTRTLAGFNDLATVDPALAAEACGWDPSTVSGTTSKCLLWEGPCGHRWEARVNNRRRWRGCPICSGRMLLSGFNDLATVAPAVVEEADGWDPSQVLAGSSRSLPWRCSLGHRWTATARSRSRGSGCPDCAGRVLIEGARDLATRFPHLAVEAHGWDPQAVSYGSKQKLSWMCPAGHIYQQSPNERTSKSRGCTVCRGKTPTPGVNDLAVTHPDLAREAIGWDPSTVRYGSRRIVRWRCPLGHEWEASVNNRTANGAGCPTCAVPGFDPNGEGFVYLVATLDLEVFQYGVTGVPSTRMSQHRRQGFPVVLELYRVGSGIEALQVEATIRSYVAANGWEPASTRERMPSGGFTETISAVDCGGDFSIARFVPEGAVNLCDDIEGEGRSRLAT